MFTRECPKCKKTISYTKRYNMRNANEKNGLCRACSSSEIGSNNKGRKQNLTQAQRDALSKKRSGSGNAMYGRSVYSVWVEKYGKEEADKRAKKQQEKQKEYRDNNPLTKEQSDKISKSSSGPNNPMYGKTFYSVWVEKYGKEEADKRLLEYKRNKSIRSYGSKNPMYGKPSPQGSGNGWSGWFKGIYFRSLLELSYLKYLMDNDIKFENGELDKHKIIYFDSYKKQYANYFPDYYLIDTKEIIEIKPKKLCGTKKNINKYESARKQLGDKFIILTEDDISKLTDVEIKQLHDNGDIRFLDRYEEKYLQRSIKNESHTMHS